MHNFTIDAIIKSIRTNQKALMNYLNDILQELGNSKVRLAKYLGVSRQMV